MLHPTTSGGISMFSLHKKIHEVSTRIQRSILCPDMSSYGFDEPELNKNKNWHYSTFEIFQKYGSYQQALNRRPHESVVNEFVDVPNLSERLCDIATYATFSLKTGSSITGIRYWTIKQTRNLNSWRAPPANAVRNTTTSNPFLLHAAVNTLLLLLVYRI